jgi:hypothetical protein
MGVILQNLHKSLGDRPQVGRLFHVHGTDSTAVFFTVNRKDQQPARPIAGMLIAAKVGNGHIEAALLSDDAAKFPKSMSSLSKTLFASWHPFPSSGGGNQGGGNLGPSRGSSGSAPIAQLHQIVLQDQSASVSLPDGWKLNPRMSQMGSVGADGPNGETAELGLMFLAGDTNNPNTQRTMQTVRNGGLRGTAYASAAYIPYGADPGKTFDYLMNQSRQKSGMGKANYSFRSETPVQGQGSGRCFHLQGTVDFGRGPNEQDLLFCEYPPNKFGSFSALAYLTTVPQQLAPQERATMGAILQSFNVNMAVVSRQSGQIAAPEIGRIHAIGQAAAAQAQQAHAQEDARSASFNKHMDQIDRNSQAFANYQLDQAVISTTDGKYHGTFDLKEAAALVQDNPDKFEFVSAPDYWKGIDY